jgi:hypothetical protein
MWGGMLFALMGLLAVWLIARVFVGYPAPTRPPQVLGRRELATLAAVADVLFPAGGAVTPSGAQASIPAYVDRLVAAAHPRQRWLMRALFALVEHATLLIPAPGGLSGLRRFTHLAPEQRTAVLAGWQQSRWFARRLVFTSLRALCALGYFADPAVLRSLRLAPYRIDSPVCEADLLYPAIGASRAAIAYGPGDLTPPSDGTPLALDGAWMPGYAEEP